METAADLQAERTQSFSHRAGASYRPIRPIESCEQAVAGGVHFATAECGQFFPQHHVVVAEQFAPSRVTQLGSAFGGAHDIGEHHGREHPVRVRTMAHAGNEFLELVEKEVQQIGWEACSRWSSPGSSIYFAPAIF